MSAINFLGAVDQISGSDLLALYSQANGDARKVSLTNFTNWQVAQQATAAEFKQYAAPVTGATVSITQTSGKFWLILSPSATIATLTIEFPLMANVQDNMEIAFNTTNIITALTLDENYATIRGAVTTLGANGYARYKYDLVLQTWYRVG